jgi:dipeptidyl aminopeptidase/acylaminoacyl peptidase
MKRTILLLFPTLAIAATIDQYLNAPFASDLSAAPSGGRIVWLLNERGAHNLWVAAAPDFKGRRLTSYKDDDGQEIGEIAWSADGKSILYVRGGDLETNGDNPNPRSLPQTPEMAIWMVPFDGGAPKKLAEGRAPAVAPDGRVAFLRNGQVFMTTLAGDKPAEVVHTKGRSGELCWSPDGTALAFVNTRTDHSFIGVYRPATQAVSYLDASVDHDMAPVWSGDGRYLAFIRQPAGGGGRGAGGGAARTARDPWSIRVADVATGAGREVWRAERGPGSVFHAMVASNQILWADGGRLVFPWEKDGWMHLFSVSVEGGKAAALTPGEFEVEHVALAHNRRDVVFSSNQDDIDRRHIWRVAAAGGSAATPILGKLGEGLEWTPEDLGGGAVAYLRSSPREIGRAVVKIGDGAPKDLAVEAIPADFPTSDQVVPQQVIFPAADGMQIHGQLFLPKTITGRHPAIVFFHGGSRRQMLLGYHYMYYYSNAYAMNQYLASQGYVVLSVNYRSGIGYGLNFREAVNYGATGGSEYNDVIGAGLYIASRPYVDSKRVGVWGGSYGGYLTAMALSRASDIFAAGVDLHGVHDWSARGGRPNASADATRVAFESSPMASVKTWKSPVLLIHGDDDRNVDFSQTVRLVEALRAQGTDFEQLIFPDDVHDFLLVEHWSKAMHAADDFFARKLKK